MDALVFADFFHLEAGRVNIKTKSLKSHVVYITTTTTTVDS